MGDAYSAALSASYGSTPYTWTVTPNSGPLPLGLTLSARGLITGTPSQAGTFPILVQVTDGSTPSGTAQRALTLRVFPFTLSAYGTASIDGVLDPSEWAHAACRDFLVNLPGGGTTPGRMCAMNNTQNLFVSLRFARSAADPGNSFGLEFDNDNDGIAENGDDVFLVNPDIGFIDDYRTNLPPCPPGAPEAQCVPIDTATGGTNDGAGAFVNNGVESIYEMSHPLNSGEIEKDFARAGGNALGIYLQLVVDGTSTSWPGSFPTLTYTAHTLVTIPPIP